VSGEEVTKLRSHNSLSFSSLSLLVQHD
jgi:hypothetical protein